MGLNRLFSLVLFICNWMSALIRMTIPGTVPALFFYRKYLKKRSTFLNAFHLHGNMMWHTGGPPLVWSQLVQIPLVVRIFKKLSLNTTCTILHQCPPIVQIKLVRHRRRKYERCSPNSVRPISYFGSIWELYVLDLKTKVFCRKEDQLHFPMDKGLTVPK